MGIAQLGAIPLDPLVSQSGDRGTPLLVTYPESAPAVAIRQIAQRIRTLLEAGAA
jgi:ATP-binding protein involved in chromosome partitioning